MKPLLSALLFLAALQVLLTQCANPKAPTGGPQDSIPPTLVQAYPAIGALNVTDTEIILEFNEFINVDKLSTNLIITPQQDIKYKAIAKKNRLILKFEKAFPDSTTITLNFFDGVTDITELNPAVNLSYVFSTGSYLDSLEIKGKIQDLFSTKPQEKILVGLFTRTDSLDIFKTKPTYFTTTNKEGEYAIKNVKSGTYKVLAFKDDNRNLTFDPSAEAYGFINNFVTLDSNISNADIKLVKINAEPIRRISSKVNGQYFDSRYSKPIDSLVLPQNLFYQVLDDKISIRIYQPDNMKTVTDSLATILQAFDSLGNSAIDTVFAKFSDQVRKPGKFEVTITPKEGTLDVKNSFLLTFTKPIKSSNFNNIVWQKDSTYTAPMDSASTKYQWNSTKTQLALTTTFDTTSYLAFQKQFIAQIPIDTTKTDSAQLKKRRSVAQPSLSRKLDLVLQANSFISVENDSIAEIRKPITFFQQKQSGKLIVNITTDTPSYTIQLVNKQLMVIRQLKATSSLRIDNLPPGDYGFRFLIDTNQDGKWSYGNILKDELPEEIYLFPDFTSLRANWEVNLDITF